MVRLGELVKIAVRKVEEIRSKAVGYYEEARSKAVGYFERRHGARQLVMLARKPKGKMRW